MNVLNLDKNKGVQFWYRLDAVLHLVLCDLNEAAIALLLHHGVDAIPGDPGVDLDVLQLDPVPRVLDEHLLNQVNQFR